MSEWKQLDIEEWILSQGDSHVSQYPLQDYRKQQKMIAGSGRRCLESSRKSDPPTSLEKMCEILLASTTAWYSSRSVLTWKVKVTKQNRSYYLLHHKTHPISDTAAGSLQSWPTPRARDHFPAVSEESVTKTSQGYSTTRKKSGVKYGASLPDAVNYENKMLPTPTTQEIEHPEAELTKTGRRKSKDGKSSHSLNLADTVKMWPTPRANDSHHSKIGQKSFDHRRDRGYFAEVVMQEEHDKQMFLTPSANEDAAGRVGGKMQKMLGNSPEVRNTGNGTLAADWVELVMGYPKGFTDIGEITGKKERRALQKGKKTAPKD